MEAPIIQPLAERAPRNLRFRVDDSERSIQVLHPTESNTSALFLATEEELDTNNDINAEASFSSYDELEKKLLKGCASTAIHSLSTKSSSPSIIVSTCALTINPSIMSVSVMPANDPESVSKPSTSTNAELDLSNLHHFGPHPVKTVSFVENYMSNLDISETESSMQLFEESDVIIRFNLMDGKGRVLVLRLAYSNANGISLLSSDEYPEVQVHELPNPSINSSDATTNNTSYSISLSNSNDAAEVPYISIEWLTENIVVYSRKPHLFCADLISNKVLEWTPQITYNTSNNKNRRSTLGNVLSLLAGTGDEYEDMPPVSALTSTINTSKGYEKSKACLFSLHTDGSVRLWAIKINSTKFQNSLNPTSVRLLKIQRNCRAVTIMRDQYPIPGDDDLDADDLETLCDPPLPESTLWSTDLDSIAMTSRLYAADLQTYALAISIKTLSSSKNDSSSDSDHKSSPICLLVLHGSINTMALGQENADKCLLLTVPSHAETVSQLSFSPNARCELHGLFGSSSEYGVGTQSIMVRYPPSTMALVAHIPESIPLTLDNWAEKELQMISNLTFRTDHDNFEEMQSLQLQQEHEKIDSYFLRRLFSSSFLGIAGNRPLSCCIQKACYETIPNYTPNSFKTSGKLSFEADILLSVREWARVEESEFLSMQRVGGKASIPASKQIKSPSVTTTPKNPVTSIYHAFSTQNKRSANAMSLEEEDSNDVNKKKLMMHHTRWKKILVAVWREHMMLLAPLSLVTLPQSIMDDDSGMMTPSSSLYSMVVRMGVTSVILGVGEDDEDAAMNQTMTKLDFLSQSYYNKCAQQQESFAEIVTLEETVNHIIASASLISNEMKKNELQAKMEGIGYKTSRISTDEILDAIDILSSLDENDLCQWACSIDEKNASSLSFPKFSNNSGVESIFSLEDKLSQKHQNFPLGMKTYISYSCQLYLKSVRSLTLSRCVLLSSVLASGRSEFTFTLKSTLEKALQLYLHLASIDWISQQSMEEEKALSTTHLVYANHNEHEKLGLKGTKVLDAFISLTCSSITRFSLQAIIDALLRTFSVFQTDFIPHYVLDDGSAFSVSVPPIGEYGLIKKWHQPRLGLRFLVPFLHTHVSEDLAKIKMLLSECLFVEASYLSSNTPSSEERAKSFEKKAAALFKDANYDFETCFEIDEDDNMDVETIFYILTKGCDDWSKCDTIPEESYERQSLGEKILEELTSLMRPGDSKGSLPLSLVSSIRNLAQMSSCKTLIMAWITTKAESKLQGLDPYLPLSEDEDPQGQIRIFLNKLRSFSHLLDRLALAEQYVNDHKLLLECAKDAIDFLNSELPKVMIHDMTESASLWSGTFQHAMAISDWTRALDSCKNNPFPSRRKVGMRRLIVGMVESGALGDLMKLADTKNVDSIENFVGSNEMDSDLFSKALDHFEDFYEAAVSVLTEQSLEQTKRDQYISGSSSNSYDFLGCLYSLHASHGDWRRAAEAMNDRFESKAAMKSSQSDPNTKELSLSALACANSILMLKEKQHQFIVGGKYSSEAQPVLNKSGHGSTEDRSSVKLGKKKGNFSNLRTCTLLQERALLSSGWQTLAALASDKKEESRSSIKSSFETIFDLAQHGCYAKSVLLAKKICDGIQNGEKQFVQVLSRIIQDYLIPAAIALSRPTPENITDSDNDWESKFRNNHFPNMAQLIHSIALYNNEQKSSFIGEYWRPSESDSSMKSVACMDLIRRLTTEHASSNNRLAVEVAEKFLDLDNDRALLPIWLEDMLLGRDQSHNEAASKDSKIQRNCGLFANTPHNNGNKADPSTLLRLYMRRGLYASACNVVTEALKSYDGFDGRRSVAMKKIPEKGHIDFIPYPLIDMLDELIDITIKDESGMELNETSKTSILEARNSMVEALEFHFQMIKISEMGVQSARALSN